MSDFKPDLVITNDMSPAMQGNISSLTKYIKGLSFGSQKIKVYYREPSPDDTSGPTTTSATYVDLQAMQINFSVGTSGYVIALASVSTEDTDQDNLIILNMNGSTLANTARGDHGYTGSQHTVTTQWAGPIQPGNHYFKIQWKTTGGTLTSLARQRSLIVVTVED